jgi:hypothetical protein
MNQSRATDDRAEVALLYLRGAAPSERRRLERRTAASCPTERTHSGRPGQQEGEAVRRTRCRHPGHEPDGRELDALYRSTGRIRFEAVDKCAHGLRRTPNQTIRLVK